MTTALSSYLLLAAAIFFEVVWAVALKMSNGFTVLWASVLTAVAYVLSLVFLSFASKNMDISIAYALWAGMGIAGIAFCGIVFLHEPFSPLRGLGFFLVIAGVALLAGLERAA